MEFHLSQRIAFLLLLFMSPLLPNQQWQANAQCSVNDFITVDDPGCYQYTVNGNIRCRDCPTGTVSDDGASYNCECPAGDYNHPIGSTALLCLAPQGLTQRHPVECRVCPVGNRCPGGYDTGNSQHQAPIPCEAGTWQDQTGQSSCKNCVSCEVGVAYESTPNSCGGENPTQCTACTQCGATGYAPPGNECTPTSDTVCLTCTDCVLGVSYEAAGCGATTDRQCNPCTVCGPGTYSIAACTLTSNEQCAACPAGTYKSTISNVDQCTTCSICPAGQYQSSACTSSQDTGCIPCPAGTYQETPGNISSCITCPVATPCAAGEYETLSCTATADRECGTCPAGRTSNSGNTGGIESCFCFGNTWDGGLGGAGAPCIPRSSECPYEGFYISDVGSPTSDITCTPCTSCQEGEFISSGCDDRITNTQSCQPCLTTGCGIGKYISDMGACNASGTRDINPATDCADCRTCADLQYIQNQCTGLTKYDTQQCANCTGLCAPGQYIASNGGCDGFGTFPSVTNCLACIECPLGQIATDNICNGKTRSEVQTCSTCDSCLLGEYVVGGCVSSSVSTCPATASPPIARGTVECCACTGCGAGTYQASPCSGSSVYEDKTCTPCGNCAVGQYISPTCPANSVFDSHGCAACSPCAFGEYISQQCDGTATNGITGRQCETCKNCLPGQYIVQFCDGTDVAPVDDAHQCAPCVSCGTGQFRNTTTGATTGACDGLGTDPNPAGTCTQCHTCAIGEYMLDPCDGSEINNASVGCSKCNDCPLGSYIETPCDGLGQVPSHAQCTSCAQWPCPAGYYIADCPGNSTLPPARKDNPPGSLQGCLPCSSCPDGHYVSSQCTGATFSPEDRICTPCQPCNAGEYMSSGCTGIETNGNRQCTPCQACGMDQYIVSGCDGTGTSTTATCGQCNDCSGTSINGFPQYIETRCTGIETSPDVRQCAECRCPAGQFMSEICTDGLPNHVCISFGGSPPPSPSSPSAIFTTTPAPNGGGNGNNISPVQTTPPPLLLSSTPPNDSSDSGLSNEAIIGIGAAGGVVALLTLGLRILYRTKRGSSAAAAAASHGNNVRPTRGMWGSAGMSFVVSIHEWRRARMRSAAAAASSPTWSNYSEQETEAEGENSDSSPLLLPMQ